jgi:hypothetical protein
MNPITPSAIDEQLALSHVRRVKRFYIHLSQYVFGDCWFGFNQYITASAQALVYLARAGLGTRAAFARSYSV